MLNRPRIVYSPDDITSDSDVLVVREASAYSAAEKTEKLKTIDDYFALPDDVRVELIDGVFYDMAAPSVIHQTVLVKLLFAFEECIRNHQSACHVIVAPFDVQLDRDEFTMVQPDLLIFCDLDAVQKGWYYGAPEFVAEILSPSTRKKDMFKKLVKYSDAGVKEYWLIDPKKLEILVHQFPEEETTLPFPEKYTFEDKVPLGISEGKCTIDFPRLQEEIKPFLDLD